MTPRCVLVGLAGMLAVGLSFSLQSRAIAQGTSCSAAFIDTLEIAKGQLEDVRDAIAGDESLGQTSDAFNTVTAALGFLEISINAAMATDPCELEEAEPEDFFDGQERAIEEVMDLSSEGFLSGPLVDAAEDAVRTILEADEGLILALLANLPNTLFANDSNSDVWLEAEGLEEAQALQAACELPAANVVCAPGDPACDRDGSTCDDAVDSYADTYAAIIEIIQ
jgi:hypothetical protein